MKTHRVLGHRHENHGFFIFFHVVPPAVRRAYVVFLYRKNKGKQAETSENSINQQKQAISTKIKCNFEWRVGFAFRVASFVVWESAGRGV